MATQGERLAAVEQRIADHESRCEERLETIMSAVTGTDAKVDKLQSFVVGLIVAVCGGSLVILVSIVLRASNLSG